MKKMSDKYNPLIEEPHRRYNILTGEWILVSPHRAKRPWQGKVEKIIEQQRKQFDETCYLCPGNERAGGIKNPDYNGTFVFQNDFSALIKEATDFSFNKNNLLIAKGEQGICKVVCFSPRHDLSLADMNSEDIKKVVDVWTDQYAELGKMKFINYVQIFENKGELMGCSNPHPHGQIWAQKSIPVEPAKEQKQFARYFKKENKSILKEYLRIELKSGERVVYQNDDFAVLVPFWAVWPFETIIISKRHFQNLTNMKDHERFSLADAIKNLTMRYNKLFEISFPYSAGIHQSPTDGKEHKEWHFHMHFFPPLLRSATIRKFMVGYEMLANPQRDITPEISAQRLREII